MGKFNTINIGDKFVVKHNIEVTVLHYHSSNSVIIVDLLGNKRDVTASHLRSGGLLWVTKKGVFRETRGNKAPRKPSPKVGQRYESNYHGWYEILEITSSQDMTIKFDDTGSIRSGVFTQASFTGKVSDSSRLRADDPRYKFPKNSSHKSNSWGNYTVIEMLASGHATVRWADSGNIQENVMSSQIRSGHIMDIAEYKKQYDYLHPLKGFHYIYMAKLNGVVIYVGQGYGKRYLHCKSGCSHNKELNKLYFAGNVVDVLIHKDGLSKLVAAEVEKQLIELIQPYCNQRRYNADFRT